MVFEQGKKDEWQSQNYAKIVSGEGTDVMHRHGGVFAACKSTPNKVDLTMLSRNSRESHHNAFRMMEALKISLWKTIRWHKNCPGKNGVFKVEEPRPLIDWSTTSTRTWWLAGICQTWTHLITYMNASNWDTIILCLNNQNYWRGNRGNSTQSGCRASW